MTDDPVDVALQVALAETDDTNVAYHIRAAMQARVTLESEGDR